mgnify:CR=1 FL=1
MIEWATFFADYYLGNFGFSNTVYVFMIWLQCGVAIGFLHVKASGCVVPLGRRR